MGEYFFLTHSLCYISPICDWNQIMFCSCFPNLNHIGVVVNVVANLLKYVYNFCKCYIFHLINLHDHNVIIIIMFLYWLTGYHTHYILYTIILNVILILVLIPSIFWENILICVQGLSSMYFLFLPKMGTALADNITSQK